jgi:hypothetical protein
MPHLPTTRAQVGSTRPTIRRARTARPAQNPQTPTQKNRPRLRAACAATPPKDPLRTPASCPTPRPTRHSPLPQHPPTHPETPCTSNQPSPQTAPSLLSCALGVGEPRTVYAHPTDVKAIYDKGTLGTERWDHLRTHRLPRYQWTFLESRTRLRLLAFRREMSTLHGMAFLSLAVSWLRACGVQTEMTLQTDWAGVRRGVGLALPRVLVWRQSFCVRWGRGWGAFRWGARSIMVVWSAVIGRMTRSFTCRACCRWTRWRRFWVRAWGGCIITTTSVCILGMGWRVGRRMGVVWRWVFRVRNM